MKMDNPSRSERSRSIAIQASLAILSRKGPGGLTFDELARESGISKGGLLHQFGTKSGILQALLNHQRQHYEESLRTHLRYDDGSAGERNLLAQIAVLRESVNQTDSIARSILAVLVEDSQLLKAVQDDQAISLASIQGEAADPDVAVLRWVAATGLAFSELLGLSPLSTEERERLFERLLDSARW
jgi:AcrR family transcriptional regulator